MNSCARTEILIGERGIAALAERHVLIAGLGGVGGACAEALCRAGIGKLTLVDFDTVATTDLNRQLVALHSTLGRSKTQVLRARLLDVRPDADIAVRTEFIDQHIAQSIAQDDDIDCVADCIDSIACKSDLIEFCLTADKPIIASMGAGGRLDGSKVQISRLDKTYNCALAREVRKRLRERRASLKCPVIFSAEVPIKADPHQLPDVTNNAPKGRARAVNGAISYLPNVFGLMMASYIVNWALERRA